MVAAGAQHTFTTFKRLLNPKRANKKPRDWLKRLCEDLLSTHCGNPLEDLIQKSFPEACYRYLKERYGLSDLVDQALTSPNSMPYTAQRREASSLSPCMLLTGCV